MFAGIVVVVLLEAAAVVAGATTEDVATNAAGARTSVLGFLRLGNVAAASCDSNFANCINDKLSDYV